MVRARKSILYTEGNPEVIYVTVGWTKATSPPKRVCPPFGGG